MCKLWFSVSCFQGYLITYFLPLPIFDVESVILSGTIIERQKDSASGEWKYLVKGESLAGEPVVTVTKLSPTGKLVFVTVFRA